MLEDKKPLGIAINELAKTLVKEINDSNLPSYIVDLILLKIELQVSEISQKQLREEQNNYNNYIASQQ